MTALVVLLVWAALIAVILAAWRRLMDRVHAQERLEHSWRRAREDERTRSFD